MDEPVYITGLGLATPLGLTVASTWQALLDRRAISAHWRIAGVVGGEGAAGGGRGSEGAIPRTFRLAVGVACQALADGGWDEKALAEDSTALIVGTSKGPVEDWIADSSTPFPAGDADGFGLSQIDTYVAKCLRVGGPRLTYSAACASGLHALIRGVMMLKNGEARRVLVVAVESSVHPLFIGSFRRLGVVPPEGVGCKPMDRRRQGFLVSEAAAAVCLDLDAPPPASRKIAARKIVVERFALAGDATHLTGLDPSGLALRHLLKYVIDDRPVDLIHAHATGTRLNDPVELAAIEASLPEMNPRPILYSHKGALGHSLGSAGLISVVLNCVMHEKGIVPGNVNTHEPLPTAKVEISSISQRRPIHRSIALATGFGGPGVAVSLI